MDSALTTVRTNLPRVAPGRPLGRRPMGEYLPPVIYVPDEEGDGVFVVTAYPLGWKATQSIPAAAEETWTMNEQHFPKGWDEQHIKRLIAELDARTDDEWLAADEAATEDKGDQTVMTVPTSLVPEIRRLIASRKTK